MIRRTFLKTTALATVASFAMLGAAFAENPMLKIGFVGVTSGPAAAWGTSNQRSMARVYRDHPFVVCVPFDGAVRSLSCGEFHARVTRIKEACNAQRADFKRPHEMRIVEDFPRSTLEKIAKAELRRMLDVETTNPR